MYYFVCSYLIGSKLNIFKTDPQGTLYTYFTTNYDKTDGKQNLFPINISAETINGSPSYTPLFTFKAFFQGDLVNTSTYETLSTDSFSEMFFNDFGAFFEKEVPRVIGHHDQRKDLWTCLKFLKIIWIVILETVLT